MLSSKEALILDLLVRGGEMYGLELVAASEGSLKRGTVYVTLARMETKGLVAARISKRDVAVPGLPRPRYRPTPFGVRLLAAVQALPVSRKLQRRNA